MEVIISKSLLNAQMYFERQIVSCSVTHLLFVIAQEQFYIMKPKEVVIRSFKLYPTTDQAARYACSGVIVN